MARSSARASPYVVEIQRHYRMSKDESRKSSKGQDLPKLSKSPNVRSYTNKSHVSDETDMGGMSKAKHVPLDPSQLNRGSLEYEDIYNQRNFSRETSQLRQYGRYSFRDDYGYRRYRKIRGYTRESRRSLGIAHVAQMRIPNGDARHVDGEHIDRRNITDTRDQIRTVTDRNDHTRSVEDKGGHKGTTEQKKIARNIDGNSRDDLELWIARQTSFPRNVKQDTNVEVSSQRTPGNNQNVLSHNSISVHDKSWKAREPPPVAPRPSRPMPQTPRSASPASSVRSNQSGASSHMSQHSAKSAGSEVSVKSILKKPKVGRVVLKEEPPSYIFCAVLSCILCFPLGIYALAKSKRVNKAVEENDYESALSSSRKVKHFCIGVLLAYIGILAVVGALLAIYFSTGKIF